MTDTLVVLRQAVIKSLPCGCTVIGAGTIPDPLTVKQCDRHNDKERYTFFDPCSQGRLDRSEIGVRPPTASEIIKIQQAEIEAAYAQPQGPKEIEGER